MTRPDDSVLDPHQLVTVRRHADRLLHEAAALGRFPTPIDDLMAAAKLTVVDDEILNEGFLQQIMKKAKAGLATVKSALSKVLGLFDADERLVVLDKEVPIPRVPFIKLHEAGHGTLPHQSRIYKFIHDCKKTLDADMTDLFEREANVFASEVLFQGDIFSQEANDRNFGIKVPIALAKQFGASNYSTFRRYVTTNSQACCVVVLEQIVLDGEGGFTANVRRIVTSRSFHAIYDSVSLFSVITASHPLGPVVPVAGKRMTFTKEIVLVDRNRDDRVCIGEAFDTKHQILVLIRDVGQRTKSGVVVPTLLPTTVRSTLKRNLHKAAS
ncbi:MAG TPA: ImmA/IrrE family metallo-endopeptidase [Pyrinomonadaceae bacterium]|nr:ImmA/IrrE family metallo-endopeptidase [Pyrinomonadaceae bacterium]